MRGSKSPCLPAAGMSNWTDDPEVWDALDDLLLNAWPHTKEFLDIMHQHSSTIDAHWKGLLFGGLGQLMAAYNTAREEANAPRQAFALALEKTVANPQFAGMMQGMVNQSIDSGVAKMGASE